MQEAKLERGRKKGRKGERKGREANGGEERVTYYLLEGR